MSSGSSPSRRRRRAAALIGRTAGTWAGQKTRARRRARPGGRTVGGRRGRSSARGGPLRRARRNLGRAGGRRLSGPVSSGVWARRRSEFSSGGKIGGEVEGGGGGERDRARGGVWPGWVARPWPSTAARQAQGRIQDFPCDQRHGPRPAQPNGDDAYRTPKAPRFRMGRWGVREGGEHQGGGLCGRRNRIALPCASLQACCKAIGVHGQVQPRRRIKDPAWVEAGWPPSAVAPERQEVCRRSERVADGETEVTQRGGVGVEAQDFGAGRGALQREA